MKHKSILFILFSALLMSSCYYDNKEELYPELENDCDVTVHDYTNGVQPILANNCLGCHSSSSAPIAGGNIDLEGYTNVKAAAESGQLLGSIKHESGYSPMPKGGGKIDDCSILVIEEWIANNFPE